MDLGDQIARTGRIRVVGVALAALAASLLAVAWAAAGDFEQPDRVLVTTTGDDSELVSALEIGTTAAEHPAVVMSLPPEELPDLAAGDRLELQAEVQVTTDCLGPSPRCVGEPYGYDPLVDAQLVLAPGPDVTGGPGAAPVSEVEHERCVQRHPNREHHCVITFPGSTIDVAADQPPCLPSGCHANLVLSASHPSAGPGDRLIVGEDEPDGSIVQDKGRLDAIRLRPVAPDPEPRGKVRTFLADVPRAGTVPVGPTLKESETVVFSQRLRNLERDDQLAAFSRVRTDIADLPYRVLVKSHLVLTTGPAKTRVTAEAAPLEELSGHLSESNGFNCTAPESPCPTRKVGVGRLVADATDEYGSLPLYVNIVIATAPVGGASANPGDAVTVTGGRLEVVRYPAGRHG